MLDTVVIPLVMFLIFPGVAFLLAMAFFLEWIDRKTVARIQRRYGPLHTGPSGILQPFADFLKLLQKEDIIPTGVDKKVFILAPILISALPLTALFLIPFAGPSALVWFEGDLFLIMFIFTLIVLVVFLAGYCTTSRFSVIGSSRAALQMLGYEIPMGLAMIGPALLAGSLSISGIGQWQMDNGIWTVLLQPLGFAILVTCMLAELEFVPFDIPEAETEIVGGWRTEYGGRKLALLKLGHDLELVLASALITALYLGGAQQIWIIPSIFVFLAKMLLVTLLFSLLRAVFARMSIAQMLSGMWKYMVPLAIIQILLIQLGIGG
ncbi:NADH-quinone oxidoreductase subunit H [Candidatus Thorarchaeota archaeon]|nr:MAG: NADH-quinone oxidoreductase subunit H [Candidatus Thorarchaeota archaeon]